VALDGLIGPDRAGGSGRRGITGNRRRTGNPRRRSRSVKRNPCCATVPPDQGRTNAQATTYTTIPSASAGERRGPNLGRPFQSHRPARAEPGTRGPAACSDAAPEDDKQDEEAGHQAQGVSSRKDHTPACLLHPGRPCSAPCSLSPKPRLRRSEAPSTKEASSLRLSSCAGYSPPSRAMPQRGNTPGSSPGGIQHPFPRHRHPRHYTKWCRCTPPSTARPVEAE